MDITPPANATPDADSLAVDRERREEIGKYAAELLRETIDRLDGRRNLPTSTYRFQFHAGFRFEDARKIVPYLAKLGITELYASPYLKAAPGSTHGYDITDHSQFNPEIGTAEEHQALLDMLREHGLGLVLDVVPNHMGILGNENPWWNDVLENGQASIFADHFDIDWAAPTRPENRGRILLPFLGGLYGDVLEGGELRLAREGGSFHVQYHDHRFPLDPRTYAAIIEPAATSLAGGLGEEHDDVLELQSILTGIRNLPAHNETKKSRIAERNREKEIVKRRLSDLVERQSLAAEAIDVALASLAGTKGEPASFDAMDALLESQPYRLAFWRVASDEINYRRFFDINALAALRADRLDVVRQTHRLVMDVVVRQGATGLRIDHPDGLLDPKTYLERLQDSFVLLQAQVIHEEKAEGEAYPWTDVEPIFQELAAASTREANRLYVVVEKILALDETLPEDWPTHGTSGYDALNRVNFLFVDPSSEDAFTRQYEALIDDVTPYDDIVFEKKEQIMDGSLSSELHVLAHQLERIALRDRRARDFTLNTLRAALREVIAAFPVYRSYITKDSVGPRDRKLVERAVRNASRRNPLISKSVFDFMKRVLLERPETPEMVAENEPTQADFAGKFQQVTAPVTAKGIEDTTFYVYQRLASLNEVGGEPDHFGASPASFHKWNARRVEKHPYAMTALSTHDTKRSEDVRARINVLSEIPSAWFDACVRWSELNIRHRSPTEELDAPDLNEEYLLYQTLLGAWPIGDLDDASMDSFRERIRAYMLKAMREAKVHTSWQNPNEEYEAAVDGFITAILDRSRNAAFFKNFLPFQEMVARHGRINGIAQSLLKLTIPGVPDTYQGTEIWDFSLVDPDNRRPVDYALRQSMLEDLARRVEEAGEDLASLSRDLAAGPIDGRVKLYVHWRALQVRRRRPELFSIGSYTPLQARGKYQDSVIGFSRKHGNDEAIVVVPRLSTRISFGEATFPMGEEAWRDVSLVASGTEPGLRYRDIFTGATVVAEDRDGVAAFRVADVLAHFPVAMMVLEA